MEIGRFKEIIAYSQSNHKSMECKVKDLYANISVDYERDLLNVRQIFRPLFQKKNYIVIELPFADNEIGALCYKGDEFGYTLLNSSLPKVNVNFALCHEIYHVFYQESSFRRRIELYMNEHYYDYKEEFAANLFAGILLMPEQSFRTMFNKFKKDANNEDTNISLIVRLMSYFEVPYMAALVRCYELQLMDSGNTLEELIHVNSDCIRKEFKRLWLDDSVLDATKKDDYEFLEFIVKIYGLKYSDEEFVSKSSVEKALQNMQEIYCKIKGE